MENELFSELENIHDELFYISTYIERVKVLLTCLSGYCDHVVNLNNGLSDPYLIDWVANKDVVSALIYCSFDIINSLFDKSCGLCDCLWETIHKSDEVIKKC